MGNNKKSVASDLTTRADLINRRRSTCALDSLPLQSDSMFDALQFFVQGTRGFVDFSKKDISETQAASKKKSNARLSGKKRHIVP